MSSNIPSSPSSSVPSSFKGSWSASGSSSSSSSSLRRFFVFLESFLSFLVFSQSSQSCPSFLSSFSCRLSSCLSPSFVCLLCYLARSLQSMNGHDQAGYQWVLREAGQTEEECSKWIRESVLTLICQDLCLATFSLESTRARSRFSLWCSLRCGSSCFR